MDDLVKRHVPLNFATLTVNSTGRTSLPATTRREAGIEGKTALVAHVEGPGRIVIEAREAGYESIWALFPYDQAD